MKKMKSSRLTALEKIKIPKMLRHLITFSTVVIANSVVSTSKAQAQDQYCQGGQVFIPINKICAATVDTKINGVSVPFVLDATAYHADLDQVEYNLLTPITVIIPGQDTDKVTLNKVSIFLDPVLKFDASFQDLGDPSSFNLIFTSFPFGRAVSVNSDLTGSLTDLSVPHDGVSLTTTSLLSYDFLDVNDAVANSFKLGSSVSFPSGTSDPHVYDPLSGENTLACNSDGCGRVRLNLAFTGSGGGDLYNFNSQSTIKLQQVPEPSSIFSLGLLGLIGLQIRRKR